jgi:hypothetical protein
LVADLLRGEILVILLIDSCGNRLRELAAHSADRHAAGLDGLLDDRGLEVDELVNIFILSVQMEEVQLGAGGRCKEAGRAACGPVIGSLRLVRLYRRSRVIPPPESAQMSQER